MNEIRWIVWWNISRIVGRLLFTTSISCTISFFEANIWVVSCETPRTLFEKTKAYVVYTQWITTNDRVFSNVNQSSLWNWEKAIFVATRLYARYLYFIVPDMQRVVCILYVPCTLHIYLLESWHFYVTSCRRKCNYVLKQKHWLIFTIVITRMIHQI